MRLGRSWVRAVFVAGVAVCLHWSAIAHANGAFPDSLQILLPADRPQQIIMSTTFGLLISDDDGQTWTWTCEQTNTTNAGLYQVGAAPRDRLFALSGDGMAFSDDQSCSWDLTGGAMFVNGIINDFFPDAANADHVLALGVTGSGASEVVASTNGGSSFDTAIYTAPMGAGLTGVEIARANPKILYVAMFQTPGIHPALVRSDDGGAHWNPPIDLEPMLGTASFRIIAIDPTNADRLFVRALAGFTNVLGISDDGGRTFATPVTLDVMSAFIRLPDGTLLVAGQKGTDYVAYRSTDGGKSFVPWMNAPRIRALAERGGKLFVSADNTLDGFALATSTDAGQTLHPLLTFDKVKAVRACVEAVCAATCDAQVSLKIWSADVCHATVTPPPQPAGKSGCTLASEGAPLPVTFLAGAGLLLAVRRRGPRRR